jgi:hypothetical protein
MVVAVSYFYDHEYYDSPEHMKELGKDMDISKLCRHRDCRLSNLKVPVRLPRRTACVKKA